MIQKILNYVAPSRLDASEKRELEHLRKLNVLNNDLIATYRNICKGHDAEIARGDWLLGLAEDMIQLYKEKDETSQKLIDSYKEELEYTKSMMGVEP